MEAKNLKSGCTSLSTKVHSTMPSCPSMPSSTLSAMRAAAYAMDSVAEPAG